MESFEQRKFVLYLEDLKRDGIILEFFSVPNGGTRRKPEAAHLVREGLNAGASDLVIVMADKVVFIEMKDKPRQLKTKLSTSHTKFSKKQIEFLENINKSSVCVGTVCYGYDKAFDYINKILS